MSHALEFKTNGEASMAYRENGGTPWHKFGKPVADCITAEEMMVAAGVDWEVFKADSYAHWTGSDGTEHMQPTGWQSLVRDRDGKVLTQVGDGWKPVQNHEAFKFFKEYVDAGEMQMETAGSLHDGQFVWALANLKEGFTLSTGDEVKGYLLFLNPHKYGKSITIKFVMTRVVCQNTLTLSLGEKGKGEVRLSHRSEFVEENVKKILGISRERLNEFEEQAETLSKVRYKTQEVEEYFVGVYGKNSKGKLSRPGQEAMGLLGKQPGSEYAPGTWWDAFNAITYANTHLSGRNENNRLMSGAMGPNATRNAKALKLALEMAK